MKEKNMKGFYFSLSKEKVMSFLLVVIMIVSLFPMDVFGNTVTLSVNQYPDIDIVLTLGQSGVNALNFEKDIKKALLDRGIPENKVNVQAIETQEVSMQNSFNWQYYGHDISDGWTPRGGKRITVNNNGANLYFDGYRTYGYADFLYLNNSIPGKKTFSFTMNEGLIDYHAMEGAGFLFNTEIKDGYIKGYSIIIGPEIRLYQIDTTISNFYNSNTVGLGGKATLVKTFPRLNTTNHNIVIEADDRTVSLTDNNQKIINEYALPTISNSFGFGPIASHSSHNCDVRSNFLFQNLKMSMISYKRFKDVIREPKWRESSNRFIVNLDDLKIGDFNNATALGEILSRTINEQIHYIAWGTNTNKVQAETFIKQNNNNGVFTLNTNYNNAVQDTAIYIKSLLSQYASTQYVIVNQPTNIVVNPESLRNNTITNEYPQGRWKINHDYNYFENPLGQSSWTGQQQKDLLMSFDKVGKYDVYFEKNLIKTIYSHRLPVADFRMQISGNALTLTSTSFDLDKKSNNNGIAEEKWEYKETDATGWNSGRLQTLGTNKSYIVQLRVKDHQGVWSNPATKYVSTNGEGLAPVASFTHSPNPISPYETLIIEDSSYDPKGLPITSRTWTVINKAGTQIYTGTTPKINQYAIGEYTVSLKVTNSLGMPSEVFSRPLSVIADTSPPEVIITPISSPWVKKQSVSLQFLDSGGSKFKHFRYMLSTSFQTPATNSTSWSAWNTASTASIEIATNGKQYLHVQAYDNANNLLNRYAGIYHIDNLAPTATHTLSPSTWTNQDVTITVTGADTLSGMNRIQLPNNLFVNTNKATHVVSANGTYLFKVEDMISNILNYNVPVTNIDKVKPTGSFTINGGATETNDRNVKLAISFSDNLSGVHKVKVTDGTSTQEHNVTTSPFNLNWTVTPQAGRKTFTVTLYDRAGNETILSNSIIYTNLEIQGLTLSNVVNPKVYNEKNPFKPKQWVFSPKKMGAGGNITFSVKLSSPVDLPSYTDTVRYILRITHTNGYNKILTNKMTQSGLTHSIKTTIPEDVPMGSKIELLITANRQTPEFSETVYYPEKKNSATYAHIGNVTNNVQKDIRFNEL